MSKVLRRKMVDELTEKLKGQANLVLVDAKGTEVPFWRATKVGSDTRIAPGATCPKLHAS